MNKVPIDPPFTRQQLKDAIPAHCFERSTIKSMGYTVVNLAAVYVTYLACLQLEQTLSAWRWFIWPIYWFVQGVFGTGLWVIAHECGHRAFSSSNWINDSVGLVLHSALLVPYHSWRLSHGRHHMHTNHLEKDEVFVPIKQEELPADVGDGF